MNALDQAFIKAFAKDRAPAATRQARKLPRVTAQPPDDNVQSVALVLRDRDQQGLRLRVDRPIAQTAMASLAPHMVLPSVQHVESYTTEDVRGPSPTLVIFEDRLASLDPLTNLPAEAPANGDRASDDLTEQVIRKTHLEPESTVRDCRDARADMEVPTLARTREDDDAQSGVVHGITLADEIEGRVQAACRPRVLLATTDLQAPALMTVQLTVLEAERLAAPPESLSAAWTAVEVNVPRVDLELLAAAADAQLLRDRREGEGQVESGEVVDAQQHSLAEESHLEPMVGESETDQMPASDTNGRPRTDSESPAAAETTRRRLEPFTPAWEVDAFRWPELCLQLDRETGGKITQSGEELLVATEDGLKVLAVTSTSRGEGRSTLALALAQSAARAGSHVALLDADASHPALAGLLGLEAPCDWYDTIGQGQSLCEAAVTSLQDGISLFPLSCPHASLAGALDPVLARTLHEMSRFFDLVVVDLPPTSATPDERGSGDFPSPIDMAVVIRNVQTTPRDQSLGTVSTLRKIGVRAVGIIENFAPPHHAEGD